MFDAREPSRRCLRADGTTVRGAVASIYTIHMKAKCAVSVLLGLLCLGSCGKARSFGETIAVFAESGVRDQAPAEPPVLTSSNHLLDLLVIAESSTITLGDRHPAAWVFEICPRALARNDNCPAGSQTFAPYGGIHLQLYAGDHLRMRLINRLPPVPTDAIYAHGSDAMTNEMLEANPVNIHTHGLMVEPRKADAKDPTYGDYVFVLGYPAGKLPPMVMPGHTATDKPIQYDIYIPPNHPSGLYWFHPHVHGLNINQLSEGLSGVITIGRVTDYASAPSGEAIPERYFILKDMQVMGNSHVIDQEDSAFCAPFDLAYVQRNGYCQGRNSSGGDGDFRLPVGHSFPGIASSRQHRRRLYRWALVLHGQRRCLSSVARAFWIGRTVALAECRGKPYVRPGSARRSDERCDPFSGSLARRRRIGSSCRNHRRRSRDRRWAQFPAPARR